jgi:hypothetical protein
VPLLLVPLLLPTVAVGQSRLPQCSKFSNPSSWDNCQGTQTLRNGNTLVGEFKDGSLNGKGTYIYADGDKYVGQFKDGLPNGQGTLTFANGNKYVGQFKDFELNGQGTLAFAAGGKYVGQFKDGLPNGQGTSIYADEGKYVGQFKDGLPNGQGTSTRASGEYVGQFKDNKYDGLGTQVYGSGDKYVGQFKEGKRDGQGTLIYPNGDKYVGQFKDGLPNGQGDYFTANQSIISSGIWADGKFVGTVADLETIRMEKSGGVYAVPVRFNDTITLNAIVDSGASDVSIPADIVSTLMRTNTVTDEDFLGKQTYVLADGSKVPSQKFRIRSLKVGNKTIENVVASIASVNATILLGQSFLSKFKSWSVDNEQHTLILR